MISPYLVRVQHKRPRNAICALLREDGHFNIETSSRDRTKVLEGFLRSAELLRVHRILDSGAILGLSQDKPVPDRNDPRVPDSAGQHLPHRPLAEPRLHG